MPDRARARSHRLPSRRASPDQVNDMRQPIAERLATFDGKVRHVSLTSVVNQNLHAKVEAEHGEEGGRQVQRAMVEHSAEVFAPPQPID